MNRDLMLSTVKMLASEICRIGKEERSQLSPQEVEMICNAATGMKNIGKYLMMEEQGAYSEEGGQSSRGYSYDGGGSYRRGVPGTGRGSRGSYRDGGGGSYDDGGGGGSYHGDRSWLIRELDNARSYASGEREKEIIRKAMEELRNG